MSQPSPYPPSGPATGPHEVLTDEELSQFADIFSWILERVQEIRSPRKSAVADLVTAHLGVDSTKLTPVNRRIPPVERPNLQLAMNQLLGQDPESQVIGLSPELTHYDEFSFSALIGGHFRGPSNPVPPAYDEQPIDVDQTLSCLVMGIWLVKIDGQPIAACLSSGSRHMPPSERAIQFEILAAEPEVATAAHARIEELTSELNVYRGKVLAFAHDRHGEFGVTFWERPTTAADEVILPPGVMDSVERHAIEIGLRAPELLAAGQHLKRGLLLYGPPGTGKTHTISYLLNALSTHTSVILQGSSVGALGYAAAIVRDLSPAVLVIEDIDIIATQRGHYDEPGHPLLFNLLNEMDGLAATHDVLFVLTTNKPDVLEPALAARPGRIDHSVEIPLPGEEERRRLLELYLQPVQHHVSNLDEIVAGSAGVTASFMKELVRRATMVAIDRSVVADTGPVIVNEDLNAALADLVANASPTSRAMFGLTSADPEAESPLV